MLVSALIGLLITTECVLTVIGGKERDDHPLSALADSSSSSPSSSSYEGPCKPGEQLCLGYLCVPKGGFCPTSCYQLDIDTCNTTARGNRTCTACMIGDQFVCVEFGSCVTSNCEELPKYDQSCESPRNQKGQPICTHCDRTGICALHADECPASCDAIDSLPDGMNICVNYATNCQLCLNFLCKSNEQLCPTCNQLSFQTCNTSGRSAGSCTGCILENQQICINYGVCPAPTCKQATESACSVYSNQAGNSICKRCAVTDLCLPVSQQCPRDCESLSLTTTGMDLCLFASYCSVHCNYCRSSSWNDDYAGCNLKCNLFSCESASGCSWSSGVSACVPSTFTSCNPYSDDECVSLVPCAYDEVVGCVSVASGAIGTYRGCYQLPLLPSASGSNLSAMENYCDTIQCDQCDTLGYCRNAPNASERTEECAHVCADLHNIDECRHSQKCKFLGICTDGECFSFLIRGFTAQPYLLLVVGILKDVVVLALLGVFGDYIGQTVKSLRVRLLTSSKPDAELKSALKKAKKTLPSIPLWNGDNKKLVRLFPGIGVPCGDRQVSWDVYLKHLRQHLLPGLQAAHMKDGCNLLTYKLLQDGIYIPVGDVLRVNQTALVEPLDVEPADLWESGANTKQSPRKARSKETATYENSSEDEGDDSSVASLLQNQIENESEERIYEQRDTERPPDTAVPRHERGHHYTGAPQSVVCRSVQSPRGTLSTEAASDSHLPSRAALSREYALKDVIRAVDACPFKRKVYYGAGLKMRHRLTLSLLMFPPDWQLGLYLSCSVLSATSVALEVALQLGIKDPYRAFQLVGFRLMNSGTAGTVVLMVIKYLNTRNRMYSTLNDPWSGSLYRPHRTWGRVRFSRTNRSHILVALYAAIIMPFVLTYGMVGYGMYPFITVPTLLLVFLLVRPLVALSERLMRSRRTTSMIIYFFATQSVPTALFTFLLQSSYNYGIMYANADLFGATYLDIPRIEYEARTMRCLQHSLTMEWEDLQHNVARFLQISSAFIPFF
jgi:hypothetical protein